jgi:hypothetical protein
MCYVLYRRGMMLLLRLLFSLTAFFAAPGKNVECEFGRALRLGRKNGRVGGSRQSELN